MNHKELEVWKKGMDLVEKVYGISSALPDSERFGLTSQMRRAAVSIPSNIAEGSARKSDKELLQFISIAIGSLAELETQYLIAIRLGFMEEDIILMNLLNDEKQLLLGFRNYIKNKS
ncbi:MAG: four helix bundle protein [Altibacter sp.]|uniref:four helix bundle protein n=1 Tax=Altibacter sp. TaxID=2024823 RepID=UPI001DA2078B|nr:four helix bundle protein [Altibacter sp.]MBZ0328378.1 four helix bundle protein [Altibacter sp.]